MTHWELQLDPRALREIEEAAFWYRQRSSKAADQYVAELARVLDVVRHHPLRAPALRSDLRRHLLRGFPYGVIYRLKNKVVQVVAVSHLKRRPFYWDEE